MAIDGDPGNGLPNRTPPTGQLTVTYPSDQALCQSHFAVHNTCATTRFDRGAATLEFTGGSHRVCHVSAAKKMSRAVTAITVSILLLTAACSAEPTNTAVSAQEPTAQRGPLAEGAAGTHTDAVDACERLFADADQVMTVVAAESTTAAVAVAAIERSHTGDRHGSAQGAEAASLLLSRDWDFSQPLAFCVIGSHHFAPPGGPGPSDKPRRYDRAIYTIDADGTVEPLTFYVEGARIVMPSELAADAEFLDAVAEQLIREEAHRSAALDEPLSGPAGRPERD